MARPWLNAYCLLTTKAPGKNHPQPFTQRPLGIWLSMHWLTKDNPTLQMEFTKVPLQATSRKNGSPASTYTESDHPKWSMAPVPQTSSEIQHLKWDSLCL